ncbi:MAG: NAD(P)-binding protein [Monoraphidium minutum]|nr:MAG: NAD(P)-binding protein [Monoraphidium minutum]
MKSWARVSQGQIQGHAAGPALPPRQQRAHRCRCPSRAAQAHADVWPPHGRLAHMTHVPAAAAAAGPGAPAAQAAAAEAGLPATYRRLVAESCGASFREVARVVEAPLQLPGPGEVLVRMHYAGINGGCETFRARGEHAFAPNRDKQGFPLGAEGAGVVVAVGEGVASLQVGQAVACNGAAAFSEFAIAKAPMCTPVPAATPEAVALVLSALTAAAALEATARVSPGDAVAVTAAAGGTGHFAVQIAKLAGARVAAITGSESKVARLRELGADVVICTKTEDVGAALDAAFPGGLDVVYEGVGGPLRTALLQRLAPGGRLLQVGYISEYPHALPPGAGVSSGGGDVGLDQLFWGGRRVELEEGRVVMGQVWPSDPRAIRRCKKRVFDLHAAGQLQVWVDVGHGFRGVGQVAEAVDYMLAGGHVGKVVIPLL